MRNKILMVFMLWGYASTSWTAPILDQQIDFDNVNFSAAVTNSISRGQSFTVGTSGFLDSIDLTLARQTEAETGSFSLAIYEVNQGAVSNSSIFQQSYDLSAINAVGSFQNTWSNFDLSASNLYFDQGEEIMIGLMFASSEWIYWDSSYDDNFAGGMSFYDVGSGWTTGSQSHGFRSYMIPTPVPEPSSVAIFLMGITGALISRRKKAQLVKHSVGF